MKFYNVKKRASVNISDDKCTKVIYKRKTTKGVQERYAVRAVDSDGSNLTKFINKKTFDTLKCPVAKK
ncbi:MAG: hypothetical protein A2017_11315 [Lentisphaerae bacterium GWF2_44_16]|nr:MAG: hypothetical protein A2017_11315 [Lentisphaerae bacterium GWF2_44_16]